MLALHTSCENALDRLCWLQDQSGQWRETNISSLCENSNPGSLSQ